MKQLSKNPKIAFVYDRVSTFGGAERVLLAIHQIWPEAPLYTSIYNPNSAKWASKFHVITSFLQKIPFFRTRYRLIPNLMPLAFESFNFNDYDIVISVTSAEAKGIITDENTLHICYLLTPTRYLWSHAHFYLNNSLLVFLKPFKLFNLYLQSNLRKWDYIAGQRPDYFIPISKTVAKRCFKYYKRIPQKVIYPPVETNFTKKRYKSKAQGDYYLVVSRLVNYKRIDLAIKACKKLNKTLFIVGNGPEKKYLESISNDKIIFLGNVTEKKLFKLYQEAKAVIFPTEEDFGIVAVEAQAMGKPVIAFGQGGLTEIIQNHTTGVFFAQQKVESLAQAIIQLNNLKINSKDCIQNALRFSKKQFQFEFESLVEDLWQKHLKISK